MLRRGGILSFAALAVAGLASGCALSRSSDVRARVTNQGVAPLRDVQALVTGRRHTLGDLVRGASATCRLEPIGESHVEIQWLDATGARHAQVVDCYFEPQGYRGSIDVGLDGGSVVSTAVDVRPR